MVEPLTLDVLAEQGPGNSQEKFNLLHMVKTDSGEVRAHIITTCSELELPLNCSTESSITYLQVLIVLDIWYLRTDCR